MEIVTPKDATGFNMSLAQLFGSGPKWTIVCGKCEVVFKKRIPMIDNPILVCPYCNTRNRLPLTMTRD